MELKSKSLLLFIVAVQVIALLAGAAPTSELENAINIKTTQKISMEKNKKIQLYYFWATWCPDCKEKLKSDLSKYENETTNFSTFSIEKDKEKIQAFVEKTNMPYAVYFDENKALQKSLKVFSVPTIVLAQIDNSEIKVLKQVSGKDWSGIDQELIRLKAKGP